MLVKIFELTDAIKGEGLRELVKQSIIRQGFDSSQVRVVFSNLRLRKELRRIRMLVTGTDALGHERCIIAAAGEACQHCYEHASINFPGFSNPALPNQK